MPGDEAKTPARQGVLWKVLDVLFAKDGRRDYDRRRVVLVLTVLALLELCIRLGGHLIDQVFTAYHEAMTRVQTTEVEERRISDDRQVKALDGMARSIDRQSTAIEGMVRALQDNSQTIREAFLVRGGKTP